MGGEGVRARQPEKKKKNRERGSCRVGGKEEGESRNLKVVREGEI